MKEGIRKKGEGRDSGESVGESVGKGKAENGSEAEGRGEKGRYFSCYHWDIKILHWDF